MNEYAIVKLIASAGCVDSRKRLQKCVYLLQLAGCELGAEYYLHLYGPYSRDVAEAIDYLASVEFIKEATRENDFWGIQYLYTITEKGREVLEKHEKKREGKEAVAKLKPFLDIFKELVQQDLLVLELAATIAFFKNKGFSWQEARDKTKSFKNVSLGAEEKLDKARQLAQDHIKEAA